jgi:type II secretory pathway component GspD/PulD (secretin)
MSYRFSAWAALLAAPLFLVTSDSRSDEKAPQQAAGKQRDAQVVVEVRLLSVSESVLERVGIDFATSPAFLDARQLRHLLEAAQGDRRCSLLQSPQLALLEGQIGSIDTTESQFFMTDVNVERAGDRCLIRPKNEPVKLGFRMTARPVVSADRRFVQLALNMNYTELASSTSYLLPVEIRLPRGKEKPGNTPDKNRMTFYLQQPTFATLAIENTVNLPDGNTVVFAGKKVVETRNETGTPVLSRIPYVNRLVRNVGYAQESGALLVMVTPRILPSAGPSTDGVRPASFTSAHPTPSKPCPSGSCVRGRQTIILAELLRAYDEACSAGRREEAERLARAALVLDPACFQRPR